MLGLGPTPTEESQVTAVTLLEAGTLHVHLVRSTHFQLWVREACSTRLQHVTDRVCG